MQKLSTSTGLLTSAGQSVALECTVTAVQLIPDATNACGLVVYDGTSASGVAVAKLAIPASTTAPQVVTFNIPVCCNKGVFTSLSGTGGNFIIHYVSGT